MWNWNISVSFIIVKYIDGMHIKIELVGIVKIAMIYKIEMWRNWDFQPMNCLVWEMHFGQMFTQTIYVNDECIQTYDVYGVRVCMVSFVWASARCTRAHCIHKRLKITKTSLPHPSNIQTIKTLNLKYTNKQKEKKWDMKGKLKHGNRQPTTDQLRHKWCGPMISTKRNFAVSSGFSFSEQIVFRHDAEKMFRTKI